MRSPFCFLRMSSLKGILVVILELVRMKMVRFHFDDVFSQRKHVVRDLDVRDVCEDVLRID